MMASKASGAIAAGLMIVAATVGTAQGQSMEPPDAGTTEQMYRMSPGGPATTPGMTGQGPGAGPVGWGRWLRACTGA